MESVSLPSFSSPPVIEVVLGAQFQPLLKLSAAHLGLVWGQFRHQYPIIEERPPLGHDVERIGIRQIHETPQFSFQMGPAPQRIWMLTKSGEELIQVQQDRFITNWRKHATPGAEYPRYENRKPDFEKGLIEFSNLIDTEGLGAIKFDQCEVTYVNHIYPCDVWQSHDQLDKVFRGWSGKYPLPDAEAISVKAHHQLLDSDGQFIGRLHIEVDSVFISSEMEEGKTPIFVVKLIARGKPASSGIEGVLKFLDIGHEAIVKGFTDITTTEMHNEWGRVR